MKYILKNRSGFSLVELIVTLSLFVILVSFGYLVISAGNDNFDTGTARAHLQHNARLLDDYMHANLGKATSMVISTYEEQLLESKINVTNNIARADGVDITSDVVDDLQFRIDGSGDKAVLEYRIMMSGEDETFEMTSSVVLDNMDSAAFGGAFDTFTSIGAYSISYDNDIILPVARKLTIEPSNVVRGTVYSGEDRITFNIFVENDIVEESLAAQDVSLLGGIAFLQVVNIQQVNELQISLTLGEGTVADYTGDAAIIIRESAFVEGGDLMAVVHIIDPEISYVVVEGAAEIAIPAEDEAAITSDYTMKAYDSDNSLISGELATWSLVGTYTGVTIDSSSGQLSVSHEAEESSVVIKAQSVRDTEIYDEFVVTLLSEGRTLQDIMDAIVTLPFRVDKTAYDSPSYIVTPEVEGDVDFIFTASDGAYVSIENGGYQLEISRNNGQTKFGNATLTGTMNGESIDKIFYFKIPKYIKPDKDGTILTQPILISTTQFVN